MKTALAAVIAARGIGLLYRTRGIRARRCRRIRRVPLRTGTVSSGVARGNGAAAWRRLLRRLPADVRLRHLFSVVAEANACGRLDRSGSRGGIRECSLLRWLFVLKEE